MTADPEMLLALLAVRLLGGQAVDAKATLLKPFKKPLKQAADEGLLAAGKTKVTTTNKAGKTTSKQVDAVGFTDKGVAWLNQAASPEALAATSNGQLQSLKLDLEADRQELRSQVEAALKGKKKEPDEKKVEKEVAALAKKVDDLPKQVEKAVADLTKKMTDLAQQFEKLEKLTRGGDNGATADKLDQAFATMLTRVEQRLQALPVRTAHQTPTPAEAPALTPPTEPKSLVPVLHEAYEKLCRFVDYQDGLIPLNRLYHEAVKSLPELSVATFHRQLLDLWDRRDLDLHVLNEREQATEPDLGIEHNGKLYYHVLWKRP